MFFSPHFQPNPAGLNQVLIVYPSSLYFTYLPQPQFHRPGLADTDQTMMVLGNQCFILNGDFRTNYETALAEGGIEACIHLYQLYQPRYGSPWSSRKDPWALLSPKDLDFPRSPPQLLTLHTQPSHDTALAA